jgi:hypothetical protein
LKASYKVIPNGYEFANASGYFTVYSDTGFVSKWVAPNGRVLSKRATDFLSANDPACGGLFLPAWHHYRDNGESDIWRKGWEINSLRRLPCGVAEGHCAQVPTVDDLGRIWASFVTNFADIYPGVVMNVRHDYVISARSVSCWITFTQMWDGSGFTPYIKEPKIVMSFCEPFKTVDVMSEQGVLQTHDLTGIINPAKHTLQLRSTKRNGVRFHPTEVTIVAVSSAPNRRVSKTWVNGLGLDGWAQASNGRKAFEPPENDKPYCRQGLSNTLTRNWEIAKRGENEISLMLHGWEGGSGLPDCLGCARIFGVKGESWKNYVSIIKGV